MFSQSHKEDFVPGIEEDIITTSEPEDKMPVQVIPDEKEIVRPNEISEKSSKFMYHKKDYEIDKSLYNRV